MPVTEPFQNPLAEDLVHILFLTADLWEELQGRKIFITGGTGFFGCWLLESFAWANDRLNLNAEALVLTRNYDAFLKKAPHLATHPAIRFHIGDVRNFEFPKDRFSCLIHAMVYQQPAGKIGGNLLMAQEMLDGMRHVLDFCIEANIPKMLLISTGAVYGSALSGMDKIPEDFRNAFDPAEASTAYHQIRRMMETLTVLYSSEYGLEAKIARCFSFIGPYMSLDGRFAVADFIQDAIAKRPITVKGDGKTVRSYLYMADLAICLWRILFRGTSCRPYNAGSDLPVTIRELAEAVAGVSVPPLPVSILNCNVSGAAPERYVPDIGRARTELGLGQHIPLSYAIIKTMGWFAKTSH